MCKYCMKYLTIFNTWKKQRQLRLDQKEHFKHGCQGHRFFLNLLTFFVIKFYVKFSLTNCIKN